MSDARLRAAAPALSALGVLIAGYLTYVHYAELDPVCVGGSGGCERVQTSEYAELAGIPVAVIGLLGYLAVGAASLGRGERTLRRRCWRSRAPGSASTSPTSSCS